MTKTIHAVLAGTAGLMLATPALAQDGDAPFNGVYVGVAGGYDIQSNDIGSTILFDRNLDGTFSTSADGVRTAAGANAFSTGFCNGAAVGASRAPGGCQNDEDGPAYYVRAGVDQQYGNLVIGFVGEFGRSEITDSVSAFSTTPANYVMTRSVDWEAGFRARGGYAVNTSLFYGTFGAGYAHIDRSFSSTNTLNAFAQSGRQRQYGFQGGGGIEHKIGRNLSIGLEYLYHQYDDDDFRVRVTQGTAAANNPFVLAPFTQGTDFARSDEKFRWHSIRATAAFRF